MFGCGSVLLTRGKYVFLIPFDGCGDEFLFAVLPDAESALQYVEGIKFLFKELSVDEEK